MAPTPGRVLTVCTGNICRSRASRQGDEVFQEMTGQIMGSLPAVVRALARP